ncbi:helix-turn-helix transcriptional regulator [Leucobacter sp. HY1908]
MSNIDSIHAVGALADPVRRELYDYVVSQHDAVGRKQAAEAVGTPQHTAKFHLDRLVDEGLLSVEYRRLSGKTGPGAGRPSKLYRRSEAEIEVTLPGRQYDLMGGILAAAIEQNDSPDMQRALDTVAHTAGVGVGAAHRTAMPEPAADALTEIADTLAAQDFEPVVEPGAVRLRNCPFDHLAKDHTQLVCGVNQKFVQGVVDGLGCGCGHANLEPEAGYCCVTIRERAAGATDASAPETGVPGCAEAASTCVCQRHG